MKYAIIGDPVEHSLSPVMHEAGFRESGIDARYDRVPLQASGLEEGLSNLVKAGYDGLNVTYPLKETVLRYTDKLSPKAEVIGAVNTVKVVAGRLEGHNTDGDGFVQGLREKGFDFNSRRVVILGAGGSAKSIAVSLAGLSVREVIVLNRTEEKARILAELVRNQGAQSFSGPLQAGDWLKEADLIIQTTSIGMKGEPYPLCLNGISPSAWVVDLIYHPPVTAFLAEAASSGCRTLNGVDMLLWQGALAWNIWFGREAPVNIMRQALLNELDVRRGQ